MLGKEASQLAAHAGACHTLLLLLLQVISKRKLGTQEEIDDVKREVQIMHHLSGHSNVVCLKNVYEDKSNVCLVMELCTGKTWVKHAL